MLQWWSCFRKQTNATTAEALLQLSMIHFRSVFSYLLRQSLSPEDEVVLFQVMTYYLFLCSDFQVAFLFSILWPVRKVVSVWRATQITHVTRSLKTHCTISMSMKVTKQKVLPHASKVGPVAHDGFAQFFLFFNAFLWKQWSYLINVSMQEKLLQLEHNYRCECHKVFYQGSSHEQLWNTIRTPWIFRPHGRS